MNYAYPDRMAFGDAANSYAGKFDVLWKGLSANYSLWDYEYEQGLDWDRVYDVYRPQFAALDTMKGGVTDAMLKALLDSVLAPLHDGHMAVMLHNHATDNFVGSSPGQLHVARERRDEYMAISSKSLALTYYENAGELLEYKNGCSYTILTVAMTAINWIKEQQERLEQLTDPTPAQEDSLAMYTQVYTDLMLAMKKMMLEGDQHGAIEAYNIVAYRYEYLHLPYLEPIDETINTYGINITYALFEGNIAYLAFDGFKISAYIEPTYIEGIFGGCNDATKALVKEIGDVWRSWFNAIQEHHQAGDLGGVIIDVRSNGGGFLNDSKYVLGALLPSGGFHDCDARFKRGSGRFDYSPLMPQVMPTMDSAHAEVTEPIVVLCNCASVSMAEHTSYGAKLIENATLIGTRTWGGFSALSSAEMYTENYAGHVGVQNETPVFCYLPQEVCFTLDGKIVEGYGIEPDIEIPLDVVTWSNGAGPDNQLDRALQHIRLGD